MRQTALFIAALVAVLLPASAQARHVHGATSLYWFRTSQLNFNIDIQPGVTNTTGCVWNDEDDIYDVAGGDGKLSAGTSTSDTICVITDWCSDTACPHMIIYQVIGGADLQVTLTSDRGGSWSAAPVRSGRDYVYQLCIADPFWGDPAFRDYPLIDGTNGGRGYLTNYTLTVTAAKTQQISGAFEIGSNHNFARQLTGVPCPVVN